VELKETLSCKLKATQALNGLSDQDASYLSRNRGDSRLTDYFRFGQEVRGCILRWQCCDGHMLATE
jgi:hypothetical protein